MSATKWQYDVINLPSDWKEANDVLNHQGSSLWELVAVVQQPDMNKAASVSPYWAYLKRPAAES